MRKGQSMSIGVIIAAILALLVLVILALIFTGRIGDVNKDIGNCENKGGVCFPDNVGCDPDQGYTSYPSWTCSDNYVCCLKLQ